MADKFELREKIGREQKKLEQARTYEENLQNYGRSLIASLYMLVRNVHLYDPDNTVFEKPLVQLRECINTIIELDGRLILQGAGNTFYLNNMLLRFDPRSFENVQKLTQEFEAHDVGGFELTQPITIDELRALIAMFRREARDHTGEDRRAAEQLKSLKVTRHEKIREILKGAKTRAPVQRESTGLDRKRYGMLLYARTAQFMRKYVAGLRGTGPALPTQNAASLIQDLVDVIFNKKQNFLGMTTARDAEDAYCFHTANVATLAVVFGSVIRLRREQLRTLGMAALFHDIGRVSRDGILPESPLDSPQTRRAVQVWTVKRLLASSVLNKTSVLTLLAAFDCQHDFAGIGKGLHRFDLGLYAKLIALSDCYDMLASTDVVDSTVILTIMSEDLKQRFDPILLRLFAETMKVWTAVSSGQKLELF